MQKSNNREKNIYINGLRGALAFALFIFHVANSGLPSFTGGGFDAINKLLLSFEFGVELFFGISGIVILYSFEKTVSLRSFLWNRITRIIPVLWVTVTAIAILLLLTDEKFAQNITIYTYIGNLLALPPVVPIKLIHPAAWSISYEFIFYGLLLCYGVLSKAMPRRIALGLTIIFALFLTLTHLRAIGFFIGILVAQKSFNNIGKIPNSPGVFLLMGMLSWYYGLKINGAPQTIFSDWWLNQSQLITGVVAYTSGSIFTYLGLHGVLNGKGLFSALLITPHMQWLGNVSYSLYLWQTLTMAAVKMVFLWMDATQYTGEYSQIVFFLLAIGPTLIVSKYSHDYLEQKLTKWLRSNPIMFISRNK